LAVIVEHDLEQTGQRGAAFHSHFRQPCLEILVCLALLRELRLVFFLIHDAVPSILSGLPIHVPRSRGTQFDLARAGRGGFKI
jgi:hypothetical protein